MPTSTSDKLLPLEIIEQITYYLSLHDRLSCILTCKTWYSQLYRSIIRIVHINNRRELRQFLSYLKKYSDIGLEVREFHLKTRVGLNPPELMFLSQRCPSLEVLKFSNWTNYKPTYFTALKKLRQIPKLYDQHKAASAIKETGSTLTHLEVSEFLLRKIVPSNEHFLMLNATPNLTHLTLDGIFNPSPERLDVGRMQFNSERWNALHVYCKHLVYINITHAYLMATPAQVNQMHANTDIQHGLKHLVLKSLSLDNPVWLYHLAFKYPNLTQLELSFAMGNFVNYDETIHHLDQVDCQTGFLMLAHELKNLHTIVLRGLKQSHFPGRLFFDLISTKGAELQHVTVLYNTDNVSLPGMNLGTINALTLGQHRTIKSLEVEIPRGTSYGDHFYTVINPISLCTRLTRLILSNDDYTNFNYNSIPFDAVLDSCPQLIELSMVRIAIHIQDKYSKRRKHQLRRFDLGISRVSKALFQYLTIRCPFINYMTVISCCWMPRELEMKIDMPNNTFEYLRVADMNRRKTPGLQGQLLRGNTVNLFSVTQLDAIAKKKQRYDHINKDILPSDTKTWYYLYDPPPTRFFFPPSFIRKLSLGEIHTLDYIVEFYKSNYHLAKTRHFQEYENRYLGKKQWKFDVATGFINITCKSIQTLKYNFNVISYK